MIKNDDDRVVFFDIDGDKTKYKQGDYVKVKITEAHTWSLNGELV